MKTFDVLLQDEWSRDSVINAYVGWLEVKAAGHYKEFVRRLAEDPEAARAEAITFNMLRQGHKNPRPGEVIGVGGVDFICEPKNEAPFAVEVTVLSAEAVAAASRLSHPLQSGSAFSFSQITTKLMSEAAGKAKQMSGYPMPRVLVIATEHDGADFLMGTHGAEELLTGTTAFRVRIGDAPAEPTLVASLKNSVFFREKDGTIEPARQSISAILLMGIRRDRADVIGVLHPDPAVAFDPQTFDRVHFIRLREWPIVERFGIEWIGPPPRPTTYQYIPMGLTDEDVRT